MISNLLGSAGEGEVELGEWGRGSKEWGHALCLKGAKKAGSRGGELEV